MLVKFRDQYAVPNCLGNTHVVTICCTCGGKEDTNPGEVVLLPNDLTRIRWSHYQQKVPLKWQTWQRCRHGQGFLGQPKADPAFRPSLLEPQPSHVQSSSHDFKFMHSQAPKVDWSAYFFPSNQATASENLFFFLSTEALSDIINCFVKPFWHLDSNQ